MTLLKKYYWICFLAFYCQSCQDPNPKPLTMVPLFSNHMVLHQQEEVTIWGTYTPNGKVTVKASWGKEAVATPNNTGHWQIKLPTPDAGGPYELNISTEDSIILLEDVLIGEIWLASGQSNMEMPLEGFLPNEPINNNEAEIATADYPNIRFIDVVRSIAPTPESSFSGKWQVTSPENANKFSAAAYFFARKLHQELNVPIGIISSTWGGTPVESWMSKEKMLNLGEFPEELAELKEEKIAIFKDWFAKFPTTEIPQELKGWENLDLQDASFSQIDFDDSNWKKANLPVMFEDLAETRNDGAYWFRRSITVADVNLAYNLVIEEGVDDMEVVYINGQKIGFTQCWNCPRNYAIPSSILKQGKNTIAIRAIDTGGPGGFKGDMSLSYGKGKSIPLDGEWRFKHIAENQGGQFLLYHANPTALNNPPEGLADYQLDASTPSVLYNGMIAPLIPYNLKGAIWYQGESNVGRADQYLKLFPGMIEDWRAKWNKDFSFYFVQIAPYTYSNELSPKLRDVQRKSLSTTKTGMVVTLDIGSASSIHPGNKQDVGARLAGLALANDYGKEIVANGPLYTKHEVLKDKIFIQFDNIADGLIAKDDHLDGFEIAAIDKKYKPATAMIIGNRIKVSAKNIKQPRYVRYAWRDNSVASLFNSAGLPASSFSTE